MFNLTQKFNISRKGLLTGLGALAVAAFGVLVAVEPAFAAQIPEFGAAEGEISSRLQGLFSLLQLLIAAAAVVFAFVSFFKASRGGGGSQGWIQGILLLIVAGVAMAPVELLNLFGMSQLADEVSNFLG